MPWLVSVGGVVIVLVVLRDVFHTLLHPAGHGELSRAVMRTAWYIARRSGAGGMRLAGPLSMLAVIATWVALTVLGWALLYLPHLPDAFLYAPGLDPARRSDVGDALYVSLVVGATLGFGDLVPLPGWLRLVTPLEALMGFALFTASVTWILQIYPALGRRRTLAVRLRLLAENEVSTSALPASVLHALAAETSAVRVDLQQYTETYYFHDAPATSLAAALPRALALAKAAAVVDGDPERRLAGATLRSALDDLVGLLDERFLKRGGTPEEVVAAYQRDHRQG